MSELKTNLHLEIAHILFLDVVGYSKLLTKEQGEVVQRLNDIVLQTSQVQAAEKTDQLLRIATGDGMALVFRNHQEAPAECALEIAAALKQHPDIQVRMGVHSGPVNEITDVNKRANLAGAGVNMAQRVMDCGDAGHILLSKRVAEDLAQQREWQPLLHDLGEVEVKHGVRILVVNLHSSELGNPSVPVKLQRARKAARWRKLSLSGAAAIMILAIGAAGWWYLRGTQPGAVRVEERNKAEPISAKSIAVLPMENLSNDKENAFFADGIQDDILTSLAKLRDLKVISRTSVMSYREKAARNLKQIGKELGVANVLEGSVRRVGNRVLVNVQLIDTVTDQHLWAERYDRTLADSITLQGELASEIASALRATLSPEEKARLEAKPTDNPEAYVAYLRGREVQLRPETSSENYRSAIEFYKEAIALDPKFVLARARLSVMQIALYQNFEDTNKSLLTEARANAEEALRLDAHSAEAHLALARCAQMMDDKTMVKGELESALRLNPNDASLAMAAAITQARLDWNDEALASYKRAAELGPREPKVYYNYALLLWNLERDDEARTAIDRALVLAPQSIFFRLQRANMEFFWSGDLKRVKAFLDALPPGQDPDGRVTSAYLSLAWYGHDFAEALRILEACSLETLPDNGSFGFGYQRPKAYIEGLFRLYSGEPSRAYDLFESIRWVFEVAVKEKPLSTLDHYMLAYLYAKMGWPEPAKTEVAKVMELENAQNIPPKQRLTSALGQIHALLGDPDTALRMVEQRLTEGAPFYQSELRCDPDWSSLKDDPRFQALIAKAKH